MAAIPEDCITIGCDVCGEKARDEEIGTIHFPGVKDATEWAKATCDGRDWTITADGTAICGAGDEQHVAAIAALLPPDPTLVYDGQVAIDFPADGD